MQKQILTACLVWFCISTYAQRKIDVLGYKFHVTLNDNTDSIEGWTEIRLLIIETTPVINLDMANLNKGKGMIIANVLFSLQGSLPPSYSHEKDKLTIRKDGEFKKGDTIVINIYYKGIPADGLIISKNKFGKRTFFADNWPNRAHYWIPCNDDPSDKAIVEFLVTAPSHYKVVANGILQEEKDLPGNKKMTHWKEDTPLPTKVMVIGVADFAIDNIDTVKGIPVSSWVFAQNKTDGFKDYSITPGILSFMIDYIGPYPYKKLANVQSKTIFGGMENASAIFYNESSVDGLQDHESLFAHEIAHQWFGDMATEKSFAHLWLSEGFATYLSHIYIEAKYGTDSLNAEMRKDRHEIIGFVKANNNPVVDSVSLYMELLNINSYEKGGWILHMLRRQLGDSIFQQSIRKYYATYAGKNSDTKDLQKIFEDVSGKNLSVFFQQWLYTPGIPKLDIKWSYSETERKINVTITQLQKNIFQFPIEIASEILQVNNSVETFEIPFKAKPAILIIDPNVSLLFEANVAEIK